MAPCSKMANVNSGSDEKVNLDGFKFKAFTFKKCNTGTNHPSELKSRIGHLVVCDHASMYCYGGFKHGIPPDLVLPCWYYFQCRIYREIWKLNFSSMIWEKLNCARVPDISTSTSVELDGKTLIVVGKDNQMLDRNAKSNLYVCHFNTQNDISFSFLQIPTSGQAPILTDGQMIIINDENLYVFNRNVDSHQIRDIYVLNLHTKEWKLIFNEIRITNESRFQLVRDKTKIFVLGQGRSRFEYEFEEIEMFDLNTKRFEVKQTNADIQFGYPPERRCFSSIRFRNTVGTYLFLIAGYSRSNTYNDVWRLNLDTFQWFKLNTLYPLSVYLHSSTITPFGKLYTFGGAVKTGTNLVPSRRVNHVYSMWITIPKLKEICWEAVLHYNPNLIYWSKLDLVASGIPKEFIERIA